MKKGVVVTVVMAVISLMICIPRWRSGVPLFTRGLVKVAEHHGDDQSRDPAISTPASTAPEAASRPASQPSSSTPGIPVELSGPEIQRAADDTEYLEASWHAVLDREKAIENDRKLILSGSVSTALWNRFRSRRFKDTSLLTDWNELGHNPAFYEAYDGSNSSGRAQFERWRMLAGTPEDHIGPIRMAIMNGKCYPSDLLYMKETQQRIDDVDKAIDAAEPLITSFVRRYNAEFPEGQLHLEPLKKHDVHRAKLKRELFPAFVKLIDQVQRSVPSLLASAASYRERRLRFLNTVQAVAILGHDKRLLDLAATFEEREHAFNSHDQKLYPPLKHPEAVKSAWDILTSKLPDLAAEAPKRLETLSTIRDIATSEGGRLTVYDEETEADIETWLSRGSKEIEKAELALDAFQQLAAEESPLVAWDAMSPSFTGEGFAPLDRRYHETGNNWDDKVKGTAADLSATLAEMDDRLGASYGNEASTPEGLSKTLNEIFKLKKMPDFWRHELRRRVLSHVRFRNFTLGPDLETFSACQDFTAVANGDDTWVIPCKINVAGDVRRIHLTVQVENYPLKSDKETFNRLYFEVKSVKSGAALFDTPVRIQGLYVGQFRDDPAMLTWDPSGDRFDIAKEAVEHGMTIFVRCLTPNCKLTQGRVVVNYDPTITATTQPSGKF